MENNQFLFILGKRERLKIQKFLTTLYVMGFEVSAFA